MKIGMGILLVWLAAFAISGSSAWAQESQQFANAVDTRFSMQYITTKKVDKFKCTTIYKVLDIDTVPEMKVLIQPGDQVQLTYPCDKKKCQTAVSEALPWADLKADFIVAVHLPNKYLKLQASTPGESVWVIDNQNNRFNMIKPPRKLMDSSRADKS